MNYYIYIMASYRRTLYVGITNNLYRRVHEHQRKNTSSFTARYNITRLVYTEVTSDVRMAIEREKQIKSWRREKKLALIEELNPQWRDLSGDWM